MFTWFRRFILLLMFLILVFTNVLSITSTAVNATLTGLVATALGISTATGLLHKKIASQNAANTKLKSKVALQKSSVRNIGKRLVSRSKILALRNIAELSASTIPFAGMTLIAAGTAWELKQLCDGLQDMKRLYEEMEIEEELDGEVVRTVCRPSSWFGNESAQ